MKIVALFVVALFANQFIFAQETKDTLYQHFTINTKAYGDFDIHVTKTGKEKKPLIIYLDGSGNFPIYYRNRNGRTSSSIALNIRQQSKDYIIAIVSKPGTPFYDSLHFTESGRSYYPENEKYRQLYSLDWRAQTASATIDFLVKTMSVDMKNVIVMGYSEGSQVAPLVAVLNKKVTHVVCLVGNALNQLYDFILMARLDVEKGLRSPDEGQRVVDSLYSEYEKIYKDPLSTSKTWYGATYQKWSSFSKTTPLENMLKLNIPILYIAGGKDNNQTILDMDYAKLEFLRKGKTNLSYKVYPNCNHFFQELKNVDGKEQWVDRLDEVNQFAIDWVRSVSR